MPIDGDTGVVPDDEPTRRDVLSVAGATALGGPLSSRSVGDVVASRFAPADSDGDPFTIERERAADVFPLAVASGGPTTSGALLWTRLDPDAYDGETSLGVEVAEDEGFENQVYTGTVSPAAFGPERDHTATVDLDGELAANGRYYYRFVYDGAASPVGRCRTLPAPDASPASLRLVVASCNSYRTGYFGAFEHIAAEEADFLLHLGDFIYEIAGDGIEGRSIELPSGSRKAHELADFRHLYRTYRADDHLQSALQRHTLIHTWDDHEIVTDRWWNYDRGAPQTAHHPRGDDAAFMRRLYAEGIRAYTEYVPVRARYEPSGEELAPDAIHENFRLYRSFSYGDLADLFVTDERLYRSAPPDPNDGPAVSARKAEADPGRTMLGDDQRQWFLEGLADSDARWKLWANEVLAAALRFVSENGFEINADAWDGYWKERNRILSRVSDADVENLVALTGDMHSYLTAFLLADYDVTSASNGPPGTGERVGVELMAPAISSDNLVALGELPADETEAVVAALRQANPHIEWFDSSHWGYVTIEFDRERAIYSAYAVDRSVDSGDAPKQLLRRYRVPAGEIELRRIDDRGDGSD